MNSGKNPSSATVASISVSSSAVAGVRQRLRKVERSLAGTSADWVTTRARKAAWS
jgi:hypothetical protein